MALCLCNTHFTLFQYYLKTGTCKFGSTCKFHHPKEKAGIAKQAQLNILGYPLRPVCACSGLSVSFSGIVGFVIAKW